MMIFRAFLGPCTLLKEVTDMNRLFSILVIAGMAIGSSQAAGVKQPIQYNKEATQKLQQKLNSLGSDPDYKVLDNLEFFKAIDQLILQGADPNTYREHDKDNDKDDTATALLFAAPL